MKSNSPIQSTLIACGLISLSACQTPSPLAEPSDLKDAIVSAVDSIVDAAEQRRREGKPMAGLYAETAKITFNVTAKQSKAGEIGASGGYGPVSLKVSNQRMRANEVGNTIEITLSSINKLDPSKPQPPGNTFLRNRNER